MAAPKGARGAIHLRSRPGVQDGDKLPMGIPPRRLGGRPRPRRAPCRPHHLRPEAGHGGVELPAGLCCLSFLLLHVSSPSRLRPASTRSAEGRPCYFARVRVCRRDTLRRREAGRAPASGCSGADPATKLQLCGFHLVSRD
jgi:hypothetical protein